MIFNTISYDDFTFLERRELQGTTSVREFIIEAAVRKRVRTFFKSTVEYVGIYKDSCIQWRFTENDDPVPESIESLVFSWELKNKKHLTVF